MSQSILITGAAGFIGGSVLAHFISRTVGPIKHARISAAVRSEEQVQSLSKLGINVIKVDLSDQVAVEEAVNSNEIDLIIHTATATDSHLVSGLINALGKRRQTSGAETCFIHSSVTTLFSVEGGWPDEEVRDTDPLFEKQKELGGEHPVLKVNLLVTELAEAHGVRSLIVPIPYTYGRGSGEWRKLSVNTPAIVRSSMKDKVLHKFDKDSTPPSVHISDLVALYTLLVEKVLRKELVPSHETSYYFAIAHRVRSWSVLDRLAESLHARGLVEQPKAEIWPSDEVAADSLGFPRAYVRAMGTTSGKLVPVNAYQLGWRPEWDEERFMESLDDEVQAVLELDTVKSTVFDALIASER